MKDKIELKFAEECVIIRALRSLKADLEKTLAEDAATIIEKRSRFARRIIEHELKDVNSALDKVYKAAWRQRNDTH